MNDEPGGKTSINNHMNIGHDAVLKTVSNGLFLFKLRGKMF